MLLHLEMFCLSKPFMQNHLRVFPAFVFSRELYSSFKRLGYTLLLKCICDAAELIFLLCSSLQERFIKAVLIKYLAPPGQASKRAPRACSETWGHEACISSSTQCWLRSTFPALSLHSHEVQLPPHFAALCGCLISPILFLTSPIIQP